jgi:hypothetical protein
MAGATGSWLDNIGGDVSSAYQFNASRVTDGWDGFFGDALNAWVSVEAIDAAKQASGYEQERTRSAATATGGTPTAYADQARMAGPGGVDSRTLIIGGVMLAGLYLLTR